MNYKELAEIIKSKKILLKDVLNEIGYTRQGIEPAIDKETIELRKLKKLCEITRISPSAFFDNGTYGIPINDKFIDNSKDKEIEYLKQRLTDKDEIIDMLKEKISILQDSPLIAATSKTSYKTKK